MPCTRPQSAPNTFLKLATDSQRCSIRDVCHELARLEYRISLRRPARRPAFRESSGRPLPAQITRACRGRPNVSLMSPASAAPGRFPPRHLKRSKQSAESSHDAKPKPSTAAGYGQAVEDGAVTRARAPQKLRTQTSPSTISSGRALQDAVRPQLSERDSIFATHYMPSTSPVTSPEQSPEEQPTWRVRKRRRPPETWRFQRRSGAPASSL